MKYNIVLNRTGETLAIEAESIVVTAGEGGVLTFYSEGEIVGIVPLSSVLYVAQATPPSP